MLQTAGNQFRISILRSFEAGLGRLFVAPTSRNIGERATNLNRDQTSPITKGVTALLLKGRSPVSFRLKIEF